MLDFIDNYPVENKKITNDYNAKTTFWVLDMHELKSKRQYFVLFW